MTNRQKEDIEQKITRPPASSEAALRRMPVAKPRDTAPEIALRSAIPRKGLRFRIDTKPIKELNRRADIVLPSARVAIFHDSVLTSLPI